MGRENKERKWPMEDGENVKRCRDIGEKMNV